MSTNPWKFTRAAVRRARGSRTQEQIAGLVGVHPVVWSRWETGAQVPGPEAIDRIRRALGPEPADVIHVARLADTIGLDAVREAVDEVADLDS